MWEQFQEKETAMNETLKAISTRFSCRNFNDELPTDEELNLLAQAAIQAPSGMNRQGWQIIVVKDKALIEEMEAEGTKEMAKMPDKTLYNRIMSRGGQLYYNAKSMILIAIKESVPKGAEMFDAGIVAENIVLAATSLGLANLHCGLAGLAFAGEKSDEFKQKLKFPEGYEFGIGILLGHTDTPTAPHEPDQAKITIIQ